MPTTPITPALLEENLMQAKTDAEKFLTHKVQLTISDQVYNTDIQTVSSWISFGQKNGNYAAWLNNAAIKNFINKAAAKNDIAVIDTKISAVDNSIIQQGRQGIYIDQEDALAKIVAAMNSSSASATIVLIQTTKDPQIVTVFPDEGIVAGRFPGKYIDIDLAKQLLTIFEGATQMGQYVVSSGKPSMPTPTGTRTIINKDPRAWSAKYGLWMPWWMGIGGEYGIHELPEWPGGYKEGEAHLGTPVSHGCVRLGVGSAQTVYNWAEIGIPVYIHK
jgi:lipoprotein-anchoring transpeptidase ErfK/SrfK